MVALAVFRVVSYTVFAVSRSSSIKVVPSSEEGEESPTEVDVSGVVCVLADRQSIAVGINKRRSGAFYNSIDGYENISSDATIQYINDLSENGVIFIVAETSSNEGGEGGNANTDINNRTVKKASTK